MAKTSTLFRFPTAQGSLARSEKRTQIQYAFCLSDEGLTDGSVAVQFFVRLIKTMSLNYKIVLPKCDGEWMAAMLQVVVVSVWNSDATVAEVSFLSSFSS